MAAFERSFPDIESLRVLDVGGTPAIWDLLRRRPRLTFVNMPRAIEARDSRDPHDLVFGDGCALPFSGRAFDIAFSNSVIEHVGDACQQQRFADEIRRIAPRYWVQTPNYWFPVEPHLLTPFLQYFPPAIRKRLARFNLWQLIERPSRDRRDFYVDHFLRDIRLLRYRDMTRLFPDAKIIRERWLGLTKSLIAIKQ